MPKSKRDKKISLTKTDKKGLALKQKIVEDVRSCVEKFKSVYVFSFGNIRNEKMKEIRQEWKPSRFFFGKNKVIGIGLGRTKEEEAGADLHKLAKCMTGHCALLFTDCTKEEVVEWFQSFTYTDFARSGYKVDTTIELKEGPLKQFSHSIEPYLRKLGLPTKLDRGIVTVLQDYEVCKEGSVLTPEKAKILELLEHRLAVFKLKLRCCWIKDEGFEKFEIEDEESTEEGMEMEKDKDDDEDDD